MYVCTYLMHVYLDRLLETQWIEVCNCLSST